MTKTFFQHLHTRLVLLGCYVALFIFSAKVVDAQTTGGGGTGGGSGGGATGGGSGGGATGGATGGGEAGGPLFDVRWNNPLGEGVTVEQVIVRVLEGLIILATPIITLMIIYSGFLYVTARGNAEQIKRASAALTYAIIGGILVIGAVAVTGIIEETVSGFRAGAG